MALPKSELREWTVIFLRTRDILPKKIEKITEDDDRVTVLYKDGRKEVYLIKGLELSTKDIAVDSADSIVLVCYNTVSNLDFVVREWNILVEMQKLRIVFVNPSSRHQRRWMLTPYIHNKIADTANLKNGLMAIFETVEPVIESDAQKPGG